MWTRNMPSNLKYCNTYHKSTINRIFRIAICYVKYQGTIFELISRKPRLVPLHSLHQLWQGRLTYCEVHVEKRFRVRADPEGGVGHERPEPGFDGRTEGECMSEMPHALAQGLAQSSHENYDPAPAPLGVIPLEQMGHLFSSQNLLLNVQIAVLPFAIGQVVLMAISTTEINTNPEGKRQYKKLRGQKG